MQSHMVRVFPHLTTACQVRYLRISVPLVPCLLDGVRYHMLDDLPPPVGEELRTLYRPRLTRAAPRAPSFRFLVRMAVRRENADQRARLLVRD